MNQRTQYLIANDGTIVTMEQPNCRTCGQLVSINDAYCPHCGTPVNSAEVTEVKNGNRKYKVWIWILALSLAAAIVVAFTLNDDLNRAWRRFDELNREKRELNDELSPFRSMLKDVSSPILISKIEIKNDSKDYNDKIYARNATYLFGRISYYGLKSGEILLDIKLYINGELFTEPCWYCYSDYVLSTKVNVEKEYHCNLEVGGLGNGYKGHWMAGEYQLEVWCEEQCLGVKNFTVY